MISKAKTTTKVFCNSKIMLVEWVGLDWWIIVAFRNLWHFHTHNYLYTCGRLKNRLVGMYFLFWLQQKVKYQSKIPTKKIFKNRWIYLRQIISIDLKNKIMSSKSSIWLSYYTCMLYNKDWLLMLKIFIWKKFFSSLTILNNLTVFVLSLDLNLQVLV